MAKLKIVAGTITFHRAVNFIKNSISFKRTLALFPLRDVHVISIFSRFAAGFLGRLLIWPFKAASIDLPFRLSSRDANGAEFASAASTTS